MRHRGLSIFFSCALLSLAVCGKASEHQPAKQASEVASRTPALAPSATATGDAQALLDRLVRPRQNGTYAPRDECGKLLGAEDFRRALAAAVLARDAAGVAALAQPDVRLGFGGDDGRERLRETLAEPGGELFRQLDALLRLGCAVDAQGGITMPWYFAQDFGDVDSYSAMLVTAADVPLQAAAEADSPVKQRLSWELVTLDGGLEPDGPFQKVVTAAGARGYMPTGKLRSLLDYRLMAVRQGGAWKISALVAGD